MISVPRFSWRGDSDDVGTHRRDQAGSLLRLHTSDRNYRLASWKAVSPQSSPAESAYGGKQPYGVSARRLGGLKRYTDGVDPHLSGR